MFSRRTLDSVYLALLPAAFIGYLLKVLRLKGCTTDDINGDIIWLRPPEEWCASVPDGPRSLLALARTFLLPSLLWPIAASGKAILLSCDVCREDATALLPWVAISVVRHALLACHRCPAHLPYPPLSNGTMPSVPCLNSNSPQPWAVYSLH